jgi:hypothetical protein
METMAATERAGEQRATARRLRRLQTAIADTLICQVRVAESGPPGSGGITRDKRCRSPADHSDRALLQR